MDNQWCERLYEARSSALVLYGRALGLSHSEAEDVLQETFVALCRLSTLPDQADHYCLRAFRNRALNYRRSMWRRLRRELEARRWFENEPVRHSAEARAMRCLEKLPRDQREVIVLKIWHQHTFDAIGRLLEISPNTAAGRYRYGLQKLQAGMKGEDYVAFTGEEVVFVGTASPLG